MGSVAVHEVVPHFPTSMFGASGGRHHSSDSPAALHHHQRSSPSAENEKYVSGTSTTASDVDGGATHHRGSGKLNSTNSAYAAAANDTPMSDASGLRSGATTNQQHAQPRSDADTGYATDLTSREGRSSIAHVSQSSDNFREAKTDRTSQQRVVASPAVQETTSPSTTSRTTPTSNSPNKIKVLSLSHIQSFATDESSPFSQTRASSRRARRDHGDAGPQYEISEMPVGDIIEMVAGLLTKITSTNDRQHEHLHRHIPPNPDGGPPTTAHMSQQTSSVLAFHGKNVPNISILSYLGRINKYCPTTYEVFLSLLVYFDRMTERVNAGPMRSLRRASQQNLQERRGEEVQGGTSAAHVGEQSGYRPDKDHLQAQQGTPTPPPSGSFEKVAESGSGLQREQPSPIRAEAPGPEPIIDADRYNLSQFFVVDSFNIHRLVIAGVTCASKFFSDIFYTNSRYSKVGGLPLVELNHLELQFLILNDFRLSVPLEEMEAYGTMLVEFYAREVVAQQQLAQS